MTNKIQFKNKYNKVVAKHFFTYYVFRNSSFTFIITLIGLFALIMLVSGMFKGNSTNTLMMMWLIAIFLLIFLPTYTFANVNMYVKRDFKNRKDMIEEVEFSKEKIIRHETTTNTKLTYNWVSLFKVIEAKDAFYIFTAPEDAFIVGKEGLVEGKIEDVRTLCCTYLKPDKKGKMPFIITDKEIKKLYKKVK